MNTGKRVKEVSKTLAILTIGMAICWGLPFAVLASSNAVGPLSEPHNINAALKLPQPIETHEAGRAGATPSLSGDITQGQLRYQNVNGDWVDTLPLDTQVSMQVSGLTNRVNVKQVFRNDSQYVINAQYLFPLPHEASVDSLRLHVGERVIEGQIHPKVAAKQIFEQAKSQGKRASLVSQIRPNIFTSEVANLAPNEQLIVEISYQETLTYQDGMFSLRFPMTVAPRYNPDENTTALAVTSQQVFDADNLDADKTAVTRGQESPSHHNDTHANSGILATPVAENEPHNNARIHVLLNEGVDIKSIKSVYHAVTVDETEPSPKIALTQDEPTNRDFVLQWRLTPDESPMAWVFNQSGKTHPLEASEIHESTDSQGDDNYSLIMLQGPTLDAIKPPSRARELILVIDTSGSMAGDSIVHAKSALLNALKGLKGKDTFNIIEFNSEMTQLSPTPLNVTPTNLSRARQFVRRLKADGGTEMALALDAALLQDNPQQASDKANVLRQVIFMTDGSVTNEQSLFNLIKQNIGSSRLFTVGIGAAPNSHFMQRAAEVGRGTFTYIGDVSEVDSKVSALLERIQYPIMTDIELLLSDGSVPEYWPSPITDLYRGEPMLISLKRHSGSADGLVISGQLAQKSWQQAVSLQDSSANDVTGYNAGLDLVWARKQITALELSKNGSNNDKVKQAVTDLSLQYHLVSAYTSLVAVDVTPANTSKTSISRDAVVRQHLPLGWQAFGTLPQTATSSRLDIILGLVTLLLAVVLGWSIWRQRRDEQRIALGMVDGSVDGSAAGLSRG